MTEPDDLTRFTEGVFVIILGVLLVVFVCAVLWILFMVFG
jgi:flagellar basal body-associated protein FliL